MNHGNLSQAPIEEIHRKLQQPLSEISFRRDGSCKRTLVAAEEEPISEPYTVLNHGIRDPSGRALVNGIQLVESSVRDLNRLLAEANLTECESRGIKRCRRQVRNRFAAQMCRRKKRMRKQQSQQAQAHGAPYGHHAHHPAAHHHHPGHPLGAVSSQHSLYSASDCSESVSANLDNIDTGSDASLQGHGATVADQRCSLEQIMNDLAHRDRVMQHHAQHPAARHHHHPSGHHFTAHQAVTRSSGSHELFFTEFDATQARTFNAPQQFGLNQAQPSAGAGIMSHLSDTFSHKVDLQQAAQQQHHVAAQQQAVAQTPPQQQQASPIGHQQQQAAPFGQQAHSPVQHQAQQQARSQWPNVDLEHILHRPPTGTDPKAAAVHGHSHSHPASPQSLPGAAPNVVDTTQHRQSLSEQHPKGEQQLQQASAVAAASPSSNSVHTTNPTDPNSPAALVPGDSQSQTSSALKFDSGHPNNHCKCSCGCKGQCGNCLSGNFPVYSPKSASNPADLFVATAAKSESTPDNFGFGGNVVVNESKSLGSVSSLQTHEDVKPFVFPMTDIGGESETSPGSQRLSGAGPMSVHG
eukprot:Clim_evm13s50 gene=Clim_evmTU13s50